MFRDEDPDSPLSSADRRLVERIEECLRPAPMSPERERAFRRAIVEVGLQRGIRRWVPMATLVAAGAAAALAWMTVSSLDTPPLEITRTAAPVLAHDPDAPAGDSTVAGDAEEERVIADEDEPLEQYLPDDYVILASYFDVAPAAATATE